MKYADMTWGTMEAIVNKLGGMDGVQRFLSGELVMKVLGILKFVCSVSVPAVKKFVASEAFGDNNSAGIKFYIWDNFKTNFLGKVEEDVPATELNIHELTKNSLDAPIRAELGTEYEETKLAHLYEMLKKQAHGEAGDLLVNGYANIFYIRDTNNNLWAVYAHWGAGFREWRVRAYSVTSPGGWGAGFQVISRK